MDPVQDAFDRLKTDYADLVVKNTDMSTKADAAAKAKADADAAVVTAASAGDHVNADKAALKAAIDATFPVPPAPPVPT